MVEHRSDARSVEARRAEDAEVAVNRRITAWQIQHGIYTGIQHIPPRPGELSLGEAMDYLSSSRDAPP